MESRVSLVTGSSRGIGRAIVIALARRGWNVVVNYRSDLDSAQQVTHMADAMGVETLMIKADIAKKEDRKLLIEAINLKFGRIDLLVNNAGMAPRKRVDLLEASEESFDEVMATNLRGPFFLTQSVAKWMMELIQSGTISEPRIINMGSISAYTASPERSEYCLSKAALAMMTSLFAVRLSEYGVLVYELRPGIIETDMTSVAKAKYDRLINDEGLTPIKRWGQPEDVANVVLAIADGAFSFSTGEIINIDGGFHLRSL